VGSPEKKENVFDEHKDAYRAFTDDRQFESWLRNENVGSGYLPTTCNISSINPVPFNEQKTHARA
jgi:hypothetical protein